MEGFVRIALLIIGVAIVMLILFESQFRGQKGRRARKLNANHDNIPTINADEILGLDPREPTINLLQAPKKTVRKMVEQTALPPLEPMTPIAIPDVYTENFQAE